MKLIFLILAFSSVVYAQVNSNFTKNVVPSPGGDIIQWMSCDLNNDGATDYVYSTAHSGSSTTSDIHYLKNNYPSTGFTSTVLYSNTSLVPNRVVDVNGDGFCLVPIYCYVWPFNRPA